MKKEIFEWAILIWTSLLVLLISGWVMIEFYDWKETIVAAIIVFVGAIICCSIILIGFKKSMVKDRDSKSRKRGYLIILGIGIATVLGIMLGYIDFKRQVGDSVFYLFITALNTAVMGVLTFYIYRVNKETVSINKDMVDINKKVASTNDKIADITSNDSKINEKIAELTAFQIITLEKRVQSRVISKSRKYIEKAELIKYMTYPYLKTRTKLFLITQALREHETINSYGLDFIHPPKVQDLPSLPLGLDFLIESGGLEVEEKKNVEYIESIFNNAIPKSVVARWKLRDALEALEYLKTIYIDDDFYQFAETREIIVRSLELVNETFERRIMDDSNLEINLINLNIDKNTSEQIYIMIAQVVTNLKVIEKASLSQYKKLSEQ
ncbi:NADH-quinone oxidoreductase subunit J [Lysinibacillus xylanilyticus]|uniref:NADH-quinone oxidoreductase subunit J n=1 Tax=Lysinibacillus xylanilyticus TaxID=582475 RepID=UPI00381FAF27